MAEGVTEGYKHELLVGLVRKLFTTEVDLSVMHLLPMVLSLPGTYIDARRGSHIVNTRRQATLRKMEWKHGRIQVLRTSPC